MRTLFIGGPGRSGTSFVAERLGAHPQVAQFKDIELKIFCEKDGLQDLFHALVETYSPNRAVMALDQFAVMTTSLSGGRLGQPALTPAAPASEVPPALATANPVRPPCGRRSLPRPPDSQDHARFLDAMAV